MGVQQLTPEHNSAARRVFASAVLAACSLRNRVSHRDPTNRVPWAPSRANEDLTSRLRRNGSELMATASAAAKPEATTPSPA